MKDLIRRVFSLFVPFLFFGASVSADFVSVQRVPEEGLQPRVAVGRDGTVHLIYFKGDARAGDVFYCRRAPTGTEFGRPMRVNHQPGSAVAAGAIRGAQIALGRDDRVHVAWMGSHLTTGPAAPDGGKGHHRHDPKSPMLYTRMKADGSGFEPERNLVTHAWGLDGGGTVAADSRGNVYVFWHAEPTLTPGNEAGRSVYLAVSHDDGATFARERDIVSEPAGACGCCGMKAFVDSQDRVHALYRTATRSGERNMTVLSAPVGGGGFASATVNTWPMARCPMSSSTFVEGRAGVFAATECRGELRIDALVAKAGKVAAERRLAVGRDAKHPAIAVNDQGRMLVAWLRGASFQSGGNLCYQVFDQLGSSAQLPQVVGPSPKFSLVAAFVNSRGDFEVLY